MSAATCQAPVSDIRVTDTPRYGVTASGHGGRIPTRYQLTYAGARAACVCHELRQRGKCLRHRRRRADVLGFRHGTRSHGRPGRGMSAATCQGARRESQRRYGARVPHGAPAPRVLCGYHALRARLDADARNAASRARYGDAA